jgi:hypothetical protein
VSRQRQHLQSQQRQRQQQQQQQQQHHQQQLQQHHQQQQQQQQQQQHHQQQQQQLQQHLSQLVPKQQYQNQQSGTSVGSLSDIDKQIVTIQNEFEAELDTMIDAYRNTQQAKKKGARAIFQTSES